MNTLTPLSDAARLSRNSFHRLVLLHLRMMNHDVDEGDLSQWLDVVWPMIEDNQSPSVWANEYVAATRGRAGVLS